MRIPYLVESDWLEAHLADEDIRILDCMVFIHTKRGFHCTTAMWGRNASTNA